jgi:Dolichyl-phosphate-mannose-protein mannosyltransferase
MRTSLKKLCSSPALIAGVAFVLRMAILYLERTALLGGSGESYGFEAGQVARALALGRGFSSPLLLVGTGPTAYLCPIYPLLLAGIFKLWGIYTLKSHIVALTLNCALAALTVLPIYAIAKSSFGRGTAVLASWLWVILPDAWHIPLAYVWDSTLSAFWFALIFWTTASLRKSSRFTNWAAYGALWAIGGMINATILSVMPFFLCWLIWNARKKSSRWLQCLGATVLVFVAGVTPWTVRNYRVFHTFIPMRSNLGLMLWVGNNPVLVGVDSFSLTAVWNLGEAEDFQRVGEVPYMKLKEQEALTFIRTHPAATLGNIASRIGSFWFEVSDRPHNVWSEDPPYVKALLSLNALLVALGLLGAVAAWRSRNPAISPYLFVLLVYPVTYYLTCSLVRYRFCMESIVVILAAYGFEAVFGGWFTRLVRPDATDFATPNAVQTHRRTTANKEVTSATTGTGIRPLCGLSTWLAIPRFDILFEKPLR